MIESTPTAAAPSAPARRAVPLDEAPFKEKSLE